MHRFVSDLRGSVTTTLATSGLLAAISTSVFVASTQDWSDRTVHAADSAVEDALATVAVPPLRFVDAYATTDGMRLTIVHLVLQAKAERTFTLDDTRLSLQTSDDLYRYEGTADHVAELRILRDRDASLLRGVWTAEDLAELDLPLAPLDHPIAAGRPFKVYVQVGSEPALVVPLEAPIGPLTAVIDLDHTMP